MASLDTLALCGIRSFGHETDDEQKLKFEKPLTLILGENGCGKSTIIEALRFVTAQKEPSGKGVFVRDPQYSQQNTIKGSIKLRLTDQRGCKVHLARSLQATRTTKNVSMKQLDSTFTREDPVTHEMKSISNRCADFTPEVLRVFGVSKSIMENVIFCTQEDSMWPLDTDQKLKEKFDQIFDSEKYNKCSKKIRDKRKKLLEDKKKYETELTYLRENKLAANTKRSQLFTLEEEISKLNNEIDNLNASLGPIEVELKDVYEKEVELSKIFTTRETTKTQLIGIRKNENELEVKIKAAACEFTGTDEDLEEALRDCQRQTESAAVLKEELAKLDDREKNISREIRAGAGKLGELKKMCEMNDEKVSEKERTLRSIADQLGLISNASEEEIAQKVRNEEKGLNEIRQDMESKEEEKQGEINKAMEKLCGQEAIVKQKQEGLEDNQKESRKLKREMEDVEASQARLDRVATSLRKATTELAEHQRLMNQDSLKEDVRKWQVDINAVEEKLSTVEVDVQLLQERTSVLRELEIMQEAQKDKAAEARRLRNRHEETLQEVLGTLPESGFRRAVESHVGNVTRQLRELQTQQARKEKDIAALEERRKHLKKSLSEKRRVEEQLTEKVLEATGGDDWERAVQEQQRVVDELQDTKGTLTSSSCMYQRYIRTLRRPKPCCPLCSRDFAADEEATQLAEELADKMRDVPKRLEENQRELEEKQEKLNQLLALKSVQERIKELKIEIPVVEKELNDIEGTWASARRELDEIIKRQQKPENDIAKCSSIQSDLTLLDQANTETWRLKLEVEKLETRLPSGGPKEGLRELLTQQDNLRHERKIARHKLDEAQLKLQKFNDTLQVLQTNKHNLAEEMRKLEGGTGSRKALEERLCDLQDMEAVLMAELQEARDAVYPLEQERSQLIDGLKQLKSKNKGELDAKRKELDRYKKQIDNIEWLTKQINAFTSKDTGKKLAELEAKLAKFEDESKSIKGKKETLSAKIGDASKSEVRRRELEDNKSLRKLLLERAVLESKLQSLEASVGSASFDELMKQKRKLKNEEESIGQKKATKRGRIGAITAQIDSLKQELNSKLFAKIDETYKKALVERTLADALAQDLLRYAACMEYAMGAYHKQQMERINSFAREYWRTIYQGNDIDYIEILTEECDLSDKRRNYTYRLVQTKGDVRMDMRNRCSAGQKMLAALIIRMALSEVFSSNCGILTLDEPTTNLDTKNVRNLARALSDIITSRHNALHSNFQLIVITHDEDFVRELVDFHSVSTYVKVSRDLHGKSRIAIKRVNRVPVSRDRENGDDDVRGKR